MKNKIVKSPIYPGIVGDAAFNLTKLALSFESTVMLNMRGHSANAKSLLSVLAAKISGGTIVDVVAQGKDEDEAIRVIAGYIEGGCEEEFVKNYFK